MITKFTNTRAALMGDTHKAVNPYISEWIMQDDGTFESALHTMIGLAIVMEEDVPDTKAPAHLAIHTLIGFEEYREHAEHARSLIRCWSLGYERIAEAVRFLERIAESRNMLGLYRED